MNKKKQDKFEGLLFGYTFDNLGQMEEILRAPFHGKFFDKEKSEKEDIERITSNISVSLLDLTREMVKEFYSNLLQHENMFNSKKYKKELGKIGQRVIDETVEMVKKNLEGKADRKWIIRPYQRESIVGENLEYILNMAETFAQSQVFIERPALEAKLQSHFQGSDYKSLTLDKLSFIVSIVALIIAIFAYFK